MIGIVDGCTVHCGDQSLAGWHKRVAQAFGNEEYWKCTWTVGPDIQVIKEYIGDDEPVPGSLGIRYVTWIWAPPIEIYRWIHQRLVETKVTAYSVVDGELNPETGDYDPVYQLRTSNPIHIFTITPAHYSSRAPTPDYDYRQLNYLTDQNYIDDEEHHYFELSCILPYTCTNYKRVTALHDDLMLGQTFGISIHIPYCKGHTFPYVAPPTGIEDKPGYMGRPWAFTYKITARISSDWGLSIEGLSEYSTLETHDYRYTNNWYADNPDE